MFPKRIFTIQNRNVKSYSTRIKTKSDEEEAEEGAGITVVVVVNDELGTINTRTKLYQTTYFMHETATTWPLLYASHLTFAHRELFAIAFKY